MPHAVILAAKRTPVGRFFGSLKGVHSPLLGAYAAQGICGENAALGAAVMLAVLVAIGA